MILVYFVRMGLDLWHDFGCGTLSWIELPSTPVFCSGTVIGCFTVHRCLIFEAFTPFASEEVNGVQLALLWKMFCCSHSCGLTLRRRCRRNHIMVPGHLLFHPVFTGNSPRSTTETFSSRIRYLHMKIVLFFPCLWHLYCFLVLVFIRWYQFG